MSTPAVSAVPWEIRRQMLWVAEQLVDATEMMDFRQFERAGDALTQAGDRLANVLLRFGEFKRRGCC